MILHVFAAPDRPACRGLVESSSWFASAGRPPGSSRAPDPPSIPALSVIAAKPGYLLHRFCGALSDYIGCCFCVFAFSWSLFFGRRAGTLHLLSFIPVSIERRGVQHLGASSVCQGDFQHAGPLHGRPVGRSHGRHADGNAGQDRAAGPAGRRLLIVPMIPYPNAFRRAPSACCSVSFGWQRAVVPRRPGCTTAPWAALTGYRMDSSFRCPGHFCATARRHRGTWALRILSRQWPAAFAGSLPGPVGS